MGELREEAMSGIRPALAHALGEGGKGMVTNGTRVRIARPVRFHAPLRAWVWLERVLASQPSTFELGFQWAETGPDGAPRRIVAQGVQRLTWVDVGPGGQVTVEPFPAFFANFIGERLPPPGAGPFTPPLGHLPEPHGDAAAGWRRDPHSEHEQGTARLWLETDETHSNFVGNIYFSHAATLVERACQKALRHMGTCPGGFFATAFQLDHLGEAMPGDTLEAEVRLAEVGATFCTFDLRLANQSHGGAKIAAGRARYRLFAPVLSGVEGSAAEDSQPQPMPEWLIPTPEEETLL
jgi:enediyne polyketide synthase